MDNFIVVGTQRTGSSALYQSLNRHPAIACGGEWATEVPWRQKIRIAIRGLSGDFSGLSPRERKRIEKVYGEATEWLGFKLLFRSSDKWLVHPRFSPALWFDRLEDYLEWLAEHRSVRVVHIVRRDSIEWLKSKYLADATGSASKPYPDDARIEIPIKRAVRRLRAKEWVDHRLTTLSLTNPYVRVFYEDFLRSQDEVVVSILQFLGCDIDRLATTKAGVKRRQSQRAAADYISNHSELAAALEQHQLLVARL